MRDICKVIKFLKENVIPKEHSLQEPLLAIATSASYRPPELQRDAWTGLVQTVRSHVPNPTTEWELRLRRIINDEEKL